MQDFDLTQFHQAFFEEAQEHLEEMERLLLVVDLASPERDDLNAIFRAAHSIKGGSGTFGFSDMADLTHVLESLLDLVRTGGIALSNEIVEASLQAGDAIHEQLKGHRDGHDVAPDEANAIKARLSALLLRDDTPSAPTKTASNAPQAEHSPFRGWHVHCLMKGVSAEVIDALRSEMARLGSVIDYAANHPASDKDYVFEVNATVDKQEIEEIFSLILSPEYYEIRELDELPAPPAASPEEASTFEGDGFGFFTDLASLDQTRKGNDPNASAHDDSSPKASVQHQPGSAPTASPPSRRASDKENESSIRVSVDKVDQLINLVGELVITQAMLTQTVSAFDPVLHENLFDGMGQLERDSRNLQEAVMSIRMLPMSSVFSRFPRVVRDLATKFGKQVELKLVGEHTELDKSLIEKLSDPLTHLVRNSLDHGIETPEARLALGKSAKGSLTLQASQRGGNIIVDVIDDGAGLNRERILAKAQEQGIAIDPDAPDNEVWALIFAPGFSTAEKITDVSGRGVGMDVVKRNIDDMGGRVEVSSTRNLGTRTTIRLPLTLAILDSMYIGVGKQVFILPLNLIVESLQPRANEVSVMPGKGRVVHVRGEYLPLFALHEIFHIRPESDDPTQGIVIILELEGRRTALFVDQLLGQHQVVIKSLETNYRKVQGVSGATIMGDGRVALILDVPGLIQLGRN